MRYMAFKWQHICLLILLLRLILSITLHRILLLSRTILLTFRLTFVFRRLLFVSFLVVFVFSFLLFSLIILLVFLLIILLVPYKASPSRSCVIIRPLNVSSHVNPSWAMDSQK